ncbi:helicase associated domain-containing protein [Streptomyces sp. DSM 40907]|uniref:helicase associated domain-containing protein n=1 Tax=Streptomyces kutzneri TaxID=3051179 RepID=UPI0028D2510C|nr:Helicase associated domain protein [Streptomyces sp. DSM 40907]
MRWLLRPRRHLQQPDNFPTNPQQPQAKPPLAPQNRSHTDLQHPSSPGHRYPNHPLPQRQEAVSAPGVGRAHGRAARAPGTTRHPAPYRRSRRHPPKPARAVLGPSSGALRPWARYKARTGSLAVPRGHVETVAVDGQEHAVKLGVWLSNTKSRRTKLSAEQLAQLAELGLEWAA